MINNNQDNNIDFPGRMIVHQNGKNFDGIIKYLQDKYGPDLQNQGIITISASSCLYNSFHEKVIDYSWDDRYISSNRPGNWLEINFKQMKVKVTGYTLKTANYDNYSHLKNWVIEGSLDKENWIEIDRQENNNVLNGANFQHYFSIPRITSPFQYIRIKSIGKTQNNLHYLSFTNIELFGELIEPNDN